MIKFFRKRTQQPGVDDNEAARIVDLGVLSPLGYPMGPPPSIGVARRTVEQLVSALTERGATDEDTPDALDPLIESWLDGWLAQINTMSHDRLCAAAILRDRADADVVRRQFAHRTALRELQQARLAAQRAADRLGFSELGDPGIPPDLLKPLTDVTAAETADDPDHVADGTHLTPAGIAPGGEPELSATEEPAKPSPAPDVSQTISAKDLITRRSFEFPSQTSPTPLNGVHP